MSNHDPTESSQPPAPLRNRAEQLLGDRPADLAAMTPEDVQRLVHELEVHQIELELQNEELRLAQVQLADSRDRYTDLYEFAPVGYFSLSLDGVIREANLTGAKLLGRDRRALIGRQFSDFVARESQDTLYFQWREILVAEGRTACELRMTRPESPDFDARLDLLARGLEDDAPAGAPDADEVRLTLTDITDLTEAVAQAEFLGSAMSHLGEGVLITSDHLDWPGPEIIYTNEAMSQISGYPVEELVGQTPRILQGEKTDARTTKRIREELSAGRPFVVEVVNYRKDGSAYDAELFITPLFDNTGHRTGFVSIHRDISERKEMEQALRESEELMRAILNTAADGIITIDKQGVILSVNPATKRMFGYKPGELTGKNVSILMPSPEREEHDGYLARYHETGKAAIIGIGREVTGRRKDGSTFPLDLSVSKVDGLGLFTGIVRDISKRKQAEQRLEANLAFSESLIETAQSIILVLDREGRVVRFNPAFAELSGWSLEEAEGRDWFETFLPERDRDRIREVFGKSVQGVRTQGNINAIVTKDGREREIQWCDAELTDLDGNLTGLLCTGVDVTDRIRLEQEVYNAAEEEKTRIAQDLHDGVGSLLAGTAMLATGCSHRLRDGKPVSPEDVERISAQIREAIGQTRALSHGLMPIQEGPHSFFEAMRGFAEWVESTSDLRCQFVAPFGAGKLGNTAVANHLYRIAQEAANNALRHGQGTKVTIRLTDIDSTTIVLTIADDGKGFDTRQLLAAGSGGIGLHTMKYRARAIGGTLTIESSEGKGTTVTCRAPIPETEAETESASAGG